MEFPFSIDRQLLESVHYLSWGRDGMEASDMRRQALLNAICWENHHGVSLSTHPDARNGLAMHTVVGPDGVRVVHDPEFWARHPWELDHNQYMLPSPSQLLWIARRHYLVSHGYEWQPGRPLPAGWSAPSSQSGFHPLAGA
ncbi:hypothetical protein GGTG_14444 [Gaeumannomyces tritici R3-111a-1]|uniref:Uncharacterized protein n=1 Tax=Gaeumannomyces tritici (strain R3-111a-1) TaxID=644352 RepID=J3PLH0_GAET3|nr:hypothetical protein GGTG_14444 [Gaeumannomyces tritici R3-111a-1]EJT67979.1 hypothetical protein GGTG_14444 [Gaeumannomyces tritici R3-111a-1]